MTDFEKLGAFYLGRRFDREADGVSDELLLYDSKDLTTHAVCVGMTGSGKTGLCVTLLEEAAIDGIPALAIDPKGDLGNLLLTFPELRAADFLPWVDPAEASRKGATPEQYAGNVAKLWRDGLADWGQDGARIARFRESVDLAVYTPGSTAGRPLAVLRSLSAPPPAVAADADAMRDRVQTAVSGLLSLIGVSADPVRSREHILISNLVDRAWREGRSLELATLIAEIQAPPFERLGVLDLESFFPAQDRFELAMSLNSLLASPGFGAWLEGEPLDVGRLLWTPEGRPRLAILSIAHLGDAERMFFVTLLLNEVVAWMRTQAGTSSLRALLYMDEVFGYFPPTANPPSKLPMLTLLKQARAYGLGVVLATQNPVDLDYKGLSNAGTWFLGRLQTERDKLRVLDGLEGAATTSGAALDRAEMDRILSGLRSRVFLMNNVHEDHPELFHTRWALSYLRGPLTREQIRDLAGAASPPAAQPAAAAARGAAAAPPGGPAPSAPVRERVAARDRAAAERPVIPPEVPQRYAACTAPDPGDARLVYRPALLGSARVHYVDRKAEVDHWEMLHLLVPLRAEGAGGVAGGTGSRDPWEEAEPLAEPPRLAPEAEIAAAFGALPRGLVTKRSWGALDRRLAASIYRVRRLGLLRSRELRRYSAPGQPEADFRASLAQLNREKRETFQVEKLRKRYAPRLARLQERVGRAEASLEREQDQHKHHKLQTVVSLGATLLGALFGRKAASVGTVGRATTTMRGAGRVARERGDVARAEERLEELREQLEELEGEFEEASADFEERVDPAALEVEPHPVRPRKSDIEVESVVLLWTPWWVSPEGIAERAF